jgi:UDP-N-acetylglucosamine 2-epimerase (non-hydrolysing)
MHRAENVDVPERLRELTASLDRLQKEYTFPVIVSTHPHTRIRMQEGGSRQATQDVRFLEPFGLFDFITLERNAFCVISDSGTVQEECAIFGVPNVTIRDVTERPETLECGSNILSGANCDVILQCVHIVVSQKPFWHPPQEYLVENASTKVIKILLGYHHKT